MPDEWLNTAEAARRLGVTVQAVDQLIDARQLLVQIAGSMGALPLGNRRTWMEWRWTDATSTPSWSR